MQRVALITGSTSGIGAACARRLHADGYRVVITGRSARRGDALVAELGEGSHFVQSDLAQPGAVHILIEAAMGLGGRLDVLVNNAAVDHTGWLTTTPEAEVRTTFEVNTFAAITALQTAAKLMQRDGGCIINITSRLAVIGVPTMGIYSASKGAILALTTAAAVELAPHNIRVNAVAPGMTRTPLYEEWISEQDDPEAAQARVAAAIPLGRIAEPEDVAAVVGFLASPAASYLTGVSIPVDGGYTAQ